MASLQERFWAKVDVRGPDECWEWMGGVAGNSGYGVFHPTRTTSKSAHKAAYELENGELEPGEVVRHTCDNKLCCNPRHLLAGTQKDNVDDMVQRGRHARGECHGNSKLTEARVDAIRKRYAAGGITQVELAVAEDISQTQVSDIVNYRAWK